MEVVKESSYSLVDILATAGLSKLALPVSEASEGPVATPIFFPPTSKRPQRKYFIPVQGYEFQYFHPLPGFQMVSAANDRKRQGLQGVTPKAKDPKKKKVNLFGRKVYSTGGL